MDNIGRKDYIDIRRLNWLDAFILEVLVQFSPFYTREFFSQVQMVSESIHAFYIEGLRMTLKWQQL